jgi:hypothetical protein
MTGSYDTRRRAVLRRARRRRALGAAAVLVLLPLHGWAQPASERTTVRLQIRVFNGTEDVTRETRLQLYPRGQRQGAVPLVLGPDQAYETTVEVGFYDIQAIREQGGQVAEIRWIEQVLVQRYPDEYGRHLQVVNFRPQYGALQIRPAQDAPPTRGWSGTAVTTADPAKEVARARAVGTDLLIVVPAATYDVRITLPDQRTQWIRGIDVPPDRTRLKTWTPAP